MEKEKEKQRIYENLVELTRNAKPNEYFSRKKILDYIVERIEETTGEVVRNKRKAIVYSGGDKFEYVHLNEELPRQKTLASNLEELTKEGKVETITTEFGGCGKSVKFYRANLDYRRYL